MRIWKKHIDPELIELFMQRLFEECGNSMFDFERAIKDFGLSSIRPPPIEYADCIDTCESVHDLENDMANLKDKIIELKKKQTTLLEKIKEANSDSRRNCDLYTEMRNKYDELKANSVVFTMDDKEF